MKRFSWRVVAATVLASALLSPLAVAPRSAFACSCAYAPIPNDLRFNDTVFSGRVVDLNAGEQLEVEFAVDHVWLGDVSGRVTVVTAANGAACGYESFAVGQRFLVYSQARAGVYETNLCSPTRRYDDASVKLLESVTGPGVDVAPATSLAANDDSRPWLLIALGSASAVALVTVVFVVAIRRHDKT